MTHSTSLTKIRVLNEAGIEKYREYFDNAIEMDGDHRPPKVGKATQEVWRTVEPPKFILHDDRYSGELGFPAMIPTEAPANRLEASRAIILALGDRFDQYVAKKGLWYWLMLHWSDTITPVDDEGKWRIRDKKAYLLSDGPDVYTRYSNIYRHRLWYPAQLYRKYGELCRALLTGAIHTTPQYFEEAMSRNIVTDRTLAVIDLLFFDAGTETFMTRGPIAKTENEGASDRAGDMKDFIEHVGYVAGTHSLSRISVEDLLSHMPADVFGRLKLNALKRLEDGDVPPAKGTYLPPRQPEVPIAA